MSPTAPAARRRSLALQWRARAQLEPAIGRYAWFGSGGLIGLFKHIALLGLLLIAAACAPGPSIPRVTEDVAPGIRLADRLPHEAGPTPTEVEAELQYLSVAFIQEVPFTRAMTPDHDQIVRAQTAVAASGQAIDAPQLIVVVDRNPAVQEAVIMLARPVGPWVIIGGTRVSTGQPGRHGYYITPTGVFLHTADILDYRAEGTFNKNGIRGLGLKGMRVWDFGWQTATKGWRSDGERGPIRLLLHATDPDRLERRIGRQASQGCVRVPAAMNLFLDRHGVLDGDYEHAAQADTRYRALLRPGRVASPLAGRILVIVDSSAAR